MSMTENPTPAAQAEQGIVGEFPCTQTQLRCWILDRLKPGNPALNVAVRWELRGAFKASSVEAALKKIIQRHEILRTCFVERDGEPRQQVVEAVDFKMSVIDLRNVPAEQRQERVADIGRETASEPFDLTKPCLFRVSLLMLNNESAFLLITAHQSCFDGWSIRVLGREVGEVAAAIDAGRPPVLPELPLQYGDFALWQKEYLESYGFEAEATFWKEKLAGAPYFEVPTDKPRGAVKTSNGNILSIAKDTVFSERIEKAARDNRVSVYSYGAAVVSAMLFGLTGSTPVLFGSQVAGRESSDLEDLIGVFINNVVMRFDMKPDTRFSDHVRLAGQTVTEALNNQNMPFNKLVELVNPVRDPARNPLISVNFNCQKAFLEDHRYGGFDLISAPSQSPGVIYDLSFMMIGRPSGWRMSVEYNSDLFEAGTIEAFLKLWQDAYELVLANPDAPLSAFVELAPDSLTWTAKNKGKAGVVAPEVLARVRTEAPAGANDKVSSVGEIWAKVLGVERVKPEDNFFHLGGHSLLALRMISAVRDRFGVKPDLETMFRNPTLKGFVNAVFGLDVAEPVGESAKNPWELSEFKSGTGKCSIYTLNHPFLYYRLASELDDAVSVYNVHLLNADVRGPTKLEDFAAQAIEAMEIEAGSGPVIVVGLCVNGVLAMEVSRQLRERGVDLQMTAVIDSWAPGFYRSLPKLQQMQWSAERRIKRIAYFTGRMLRGKISLIAYLKEFNITLALMKMLGVGRAAPSAEEETNAVVTDMLVTAARDYKVQPSLDLPVIMFRSQANHRRARKLLFGWKGAVAEGTEVIELEGWHEDSLTQSGISKLASMVGRKLQRGRV